MSKNKYTNRVDAGLFLAEALKDKKIFNGLIIAIPKGGVITAAKVAETLNLPLDICMPQKIRAPYNPEVAIGAVTQDGAVLLTDNKQLLQFVNKGLIKSKAKQKIKEINKKMLEYRGSTDYPDYSGKTAVIIDDGIATGFTTKAAIISIKKLIKPQRTILAIPVAPPNVIEKLSTAVDEIICPLMPEPFYAVGQFYENFDQVTDEEVISIIQRQKLTPRM